MTQLVVIDTSCLYTFCNHDKRDRLQQYLGSSARITLEVRDEIADKAREVPKLAELIQPPIWPEWVCLSTAQLQELFDIAKYERRIMGGFTKQDCR